jgi:clan AA aspartic protease (TIGR02281 family)
MRRFLKSALLGSVLALGLMAPAYAGETKNWTTVGNWSVDIHDDGECTVDRDYPRGMRMMFGWSRKRSGVWIGFGHADWKDKVEKDKQYDIVMVTDGTRWNPTIYWGFPNAKTGAFLSDKTFSPEFLAAMARGNMVEFWYANDWLAKLPLDGSAAAIQALLQCQTAQDNNTQSSKTTPPPSGNSTGPWTVPISRNGTLITLKARLNDGVATTFMLDTGATVVSIPQDMADRMGLKAIRYENVTYGDGSVGREAVVVISKVALVTADGGTVYLSNVEAMVGKVGAPLLIGKNFLDKFSSYQIDNRAAQLVLKQ